VRGIGEADLIDGAVLSGSGAMHEPIKQGGGAVLLKVGAAGPVLAAAAGSP
jgi:hypothetical protein